jgi:hypothetical protein
MIAKRKMQADLDRRIAAHHVAGHVVAAVVLDLPLKEVSIGPCDPRIRTCPYAAVWTPEDSQEPSAARNTMIALLAGYEAGFYYEFQRRRVFFGSKLNSIADYDHARTVAAERHPDPASAKSYLERMKTRAAAFVRDPAHWEAIVAVAEQLLQAPATSLGRRELRALVNDAVAHAKALTHN